MTLDKKLVDKFINVTSRAALASSYLVGKKDKILADKAAVDSMRNNLNDMNILEVAMKPYFVPETTTLDQQMKQFLKRKSHFALVVDEYGDLRGLITLEDILEEIVGQISDEHDVIEQQVKELNDRSIIVEGNMTIRDLNRHRDWNIPDEEANTVAGLVIHEAQSIPSEKQIFIFNGFRYEILKRKGNRITKIKIKKLGS